MVENPSGSEVMVLSVEQVALEAHQLVSGRKESHSEEFHDGPIGRVGMTKQVRHELLQEGQAIPHRRT